MTKNLALLALASCKREVDELKRRNQEAEKELEELKQKVEQFRWWLLNKDAPPVNGAVAESEIRQKYRKVFGVQKVQLDKEIRHDADMHIADGY